MMILAALLLASPFGHDHSISDDGAWCWFADPRAIWVGGDILSGGVSQAGDVTVHQYDPRSKARKDHVLFASLERDDHNNPALLRLADGRIAAFFSKHSGPDLYLSMTREAKDLSSWESPVKINPNDPTYKGPANSINTYTYPNAQMLSGEANRIYLFWRGMNWKPTFSVSDDQGETWSPGKIVVSPKDGDRWNRPYAKYASDGKSTIHMAFTDGHPRNEPTNSIYYARYESGGFHRATGAKIADLNQLPFSKDDADVVYDGKVEGIRSWIWDMAFDGNGNPVITYSRLLKEDQHYYRYVRFDGRRWVDRPIVFGGKWFPQTPEGKAEPEPHYSGGVTLDPNDPRFVYLSRPINGQFEIERWFTPDGGDTWSHVAVTGESKHDSVRPYVIRGNRPAEIGPNALWMNFASYVDYQHYRSTIQAADEDKGPFVSSDPMRTADAVYRWVRSNPSPYPKYEWMVAPLFSGVLEYGEYRKSAAAIDWVRSEGLTNGYKMGPRKSYADDVAVGQAYLRLYQIDKNPLQLASAKEWIDGFTAMPHTRTLEWKDGVHMEELAWCDALYMAPPTMALLSEVTGDAKYINKMNTLWWKTSDYLYDPVEHLYYRDQRYFNQREANGKKVFWSRGNGWVLAGLARVLESMPNDFPDRGRYISQYRAMAKKLAGLQTADGTWHASLLDPESYPVPETSGTGFFVYAMAWGVNAGILDRVTYGPVIEKGFRALSDAVDPSGRVSWIQPVGADPKAVRASDTDTYGVGAFLLAACEVDRMRRNR